MGFMICVGALGCNKCFSRRGTLGPPPTYLFSRYEDGVFEKYNVKVLGRLDLVEGTP